MAKAKASQQTKNKSVAKFEFPRKVLNKLPVTERDQAAAKLWEKSGGLCHLCGYPLSPKEADVDHVVPESHGGATELANLYLAHKTCNRARGDLSVDAAKPIVGFKAFCDAKGAVTFDDVLDRYIKHPRPSRQPVQVRVLASSIELRSASWSIEAPVQVDPATGTKYFFADIPTAHLFNDSEVQPRLISYAHVRALALDFMKRPVHEPSNCRLVKDGGTTGSLLQFDGQHKSTAQILLGRDAVQMKIYVEPDVAMVQDLVVKIQQEIKKVPLTRSDTLAKLGDVIKRVLEAYLSQPGAHTEEGFVASQPKSERKTLLQLYRGELQRLVFFDEDNELAKRVRPGVEGAPTSDKVVLERIIRPLIYRDMLGLNMEDSGGRDNEREMIILILNTIVSKMLPEGWDRPESELAKRRATNFFYQASIGWWMDQLDLALRYVTQRIEPNTPLFVDRIDQATQDRVVKAVEKLCDLSVWSTQDEDVVKAMRSNTVKNLAPLMEKDAWKKLIK